MLNEHRKMGKSAWKNISFLALFLHQQSMQVIAFKKPLTDVLLKMNRNSRLSFWVFLSPFCLKRSIAGRLILVKSNKLYPRVNKKVAAVA